MSTSSNTSVSELFENNGLEGLLEKSVDELTDEELQQLGEAFDLVHESELEAGAASADDPSDYTTGVLGDSGESDLPVSDEMLELTGADSAEEFREMAAEVFADSSDAPSDYETGVSEHEENEKLAHLSRRGRHTAPARQRTNDDESNSQ